MDDHEANTEISLPDSLKELIRSKVTSNGPAHSSFSANFNVASA